MFNPYQQHISIFLTKAKDNVAYYNLSGSRIVVSIKGSPKNMTLVKTWPSQKLLTVSVEY